MQKVNIGEAAVCSKCGSNITTLGKFSYLGSTSNTPRDKDEGCKCNNCNTEFILHYDYFDSEGHVNSFIFGNDINDPAYNWQDQLTPEQKKEIGEHLRTCQICSDRLHTEMTSDAWLASLIHKK